MFEKILIANRSEIAIRVIHTCREMGIKTVAVYSDVDKKALHVLSADEAVYIGPSEPSLSYLNIEAIIKAAKQTRAQAIHPGYGFLSENYKFAQRCKDEGLVFIGPSAEAIRNLGDKITSRKIMLDSGVPVTPGLNGMTGCTSDMAVSVDTSDLTDAVEEIGYPVLVKATAGGGGKGIRIVNSSDEIKEAVASASREALKAFGNGNVYIEKFFTRARHIEFQILADKYGNTIHLFERECSIQRRHQKIIEETPALILTSELRQEMGAAAVRAAKASHYENAGTVEFLLDDKNNFYFLEINTRLQVEHPITEMTTGVDLVRHQIEIAAGQSLRLRQEDIHPRGHAIECRIYAEDPEKDFLPSPGKIIFMKEPSGPGIRNDCGIYQGFEVPVDYDPILSKLVVHAQTRDQAISKMVKALEDYVVLGVKTPIEFMVNVLNSRPFRSGEVFTDFIKAHFAGWKSNREFNSSERELADSAREPGDSESEFIDSAREFSNSESESIDSERELSNFEPLSIYSASELIDVAMIAFIADAVGGAKNNSNSFSDTKKTVSPWGTLGNWQL
ncbi:MAG: acetyl-CoA carboxylase biotin carboxylase subunit [Desulfamplus sp.]|nr:acetyl-CoA carboxylase biotin carboxylase subunit [Desulfamplus sp.]